MGPAGFELEEVFWGVWARSFFIFVLFYPVLGFLFVLSFCVSFFFAFRKYVYAGCEAGEVLGGN